MNAARLPSLNGRRMVRALERIGFTVARIVGSHHVMAHSDGRVVVIPVHGGRDLKPGTLRAIIRQIGMTVDEFAELL